MKPIKDKNINIHDINLGLYSKDSYLKYAMSVVKGRSIPYIQDGLKPVHRRILYTMKTLKLFSTANITKSARVVGEVLGKYHPHGDASVYDAMVIMSQPFSTRYPLVHGEGNWGTRDGDSAAAMRYTEAKLTPFADTLLSELSWDTVDYQPNYDGKETEPMVLPSRLPLLLLNGTSGIGVGLATEIPSHNLNEVVEATIYLLKNPKATIDDILNIIKGPDFPTGSQLITPASDIRKFYKSGKGSFKLRAKWRVEYAPNKKDWSLVFYEIPQGTSVSQILLQINALVNPTVSEPKDKKGKKDKKEKKATLSQKQLTLKRFFGDLIENFQDLSDQELSLTITPKQRKQDPEVLANALLAHTDLEKNYPLNFVAVDENGNPRLDNLLSWMQQWCNFRMTTITRLYQDQLNKVEHRLHILEGRLLILDKIFEVIKLITESKQPKIDLMEKYSLSEIQAEDILEMRLRALSRMEKEGIEDEYKELTKKQQKLVKILSSEANIKKEVIKELEIDMKAHGDARRTTIEEAEAVNPKDLVTEIVQDKATNETIAVAITERGWLSWKIAKSMDDVSEADFKLKTGDNIRRQFFGSRASVLMLLDQQGKGYSINLVDLPGRNDTNSFSAFIEPGAKIVDGVMGTPDDHFLLSGENGYGFIIKGSNWISKLKAGKAIISLAESEFPLQPLPVPISADEEENKKQILVTLSSEGKSVAMPLSDVKILGKGKGVALMGLGKDAKLLDLTLVKSDGTVILKNEDKESVIPHKEIQKVLKARSSSHKGKAFAPKTVWTGFNRDIEKPIEDKETDDDNGTE